MNFTSFVCLCVFVLSFFLTLENISLIWRRHHYRWRVANFDLYARHLWPLSSESSLACHTYWDTGHPFIMAISADPWHSHLLPSVWQWSCHYLFIRLRSVASWIRTPNLPLANKNNDLLFYGWKNFLCFQFQSRMFHSFRDVTLASEGPENLSLCLTLTAFEQGGVLTWHTCFNLGPRFTRSNSKDQSVKSHPSTCQGY